MNELKYPATEPSPARPKHMPVLDPEIQCIGDAAYEDIRESRKVNPRTNEQIAEIINQDRCRNQARISPEWVYHWKRDNHHWTLAELLAVIEVTGGRRTIDFIRLNFASRSPIIRGSVSLAQLRVGELNLMSAQLNRLVIESAADHLLDCQELLVIRAGLADIRAKIEETTAQIESMLQEV